MCCPLERCEWWVRKASVWHSTANYSAPFWNDIEGFRVGKQKDNFEPHRHIRRWPPRTLFDLDPKLGPGLTSRLEVAGRR